jgi:hypothetical protein
MYENWSSRQLHLVTRTIANCVNRDISSHIAAGGNTRVPSSSSNYHSSSSSVSHHYPISFRPSHRMTPSSTRMSVSNPKKTIFTNTGNGQIRRTRLDLKTTDFGLIFSPERDPSMNAGLRKYRLLIRPRTPRTDRGQESDLTHSAGEN